MLVVLETGISGEVSGLQELYHESFGAHVATTYLTSEHKVKACHVLESRKKARISEETQPYDCCEGSILLYAPK